MKLISSFWTVVIISVSVCVIFLSFGFFHEWVPKSTQATYDNNLAQQLQDQADKLPRARKRKADAIAMVKAKTAEWNTYVATRTPPPSVRAGGIDVSVDPYRLAIDTFTFRNNVQRAVNAQIKKGGVKIVGDAPTVPLPSDTNNVGGLLASYYHYPGIKFPVIIFNLGQVQVRGTYGQIMEHIRAYKTMPNYLAETDGLRLDGTSPLLTATYQLSIVGIIRATKVFGAIPEAAAATNVGGGFGGGPGGPMGFGGRGGPPPGIPGGPGRGGPKGAAMAGGGG